MNLNRIKIKELDRINSFYQNLNGEIRVPSRMAYLVMGFQIAVLLITTLGPIFLICLNAFIVLNNYSKNAHNQNFQAQCCAFPFTLIYYLFIYSKVIKPTIRSFRKLKRYIINPEKTFTDLRPPVLLLRSFLSDREDNIVQIDKLTPEEVLVEALSTSGPVITAGQPGEAGLPLLGATRIYLEQDWDKSILELIKVANIIVIDASNTKSLAWEMQCVRNLVHPRRVLISFLAKQDTIDNKTEILEPKRNFELFYRGFSNTFQQNFGSSLPEFDSNTFLIQFDDSWNPYAIKFLPNSTNQSKTMKYVPVNNLLTGLSSFFINLNNLNDKSSVNSSQNG
jgi:hypothetical protein